MSTSADASNKPFTSSPAAVARSATTSRLCIAPMAPAEQPPKSSRWPGEPPMPWFVSSAVTTAATMREPRKAKP